MTNRRLTVLWLGVVGVSVSATAMRLAGVVHGDTLDYVIGLTGLAVTFSSLGTLIVRRRPGHRFGMMLLALATTQCVNVVLRLWATSLPPQSTAAGTVALVEELLRVEALGAAGLLLLLFPTGRLLSRRWRIVAVLFLVGPAIGWVAELTTPGVIDGIRPVRNPFATASTAKVAHALAPAGALAGILFLAAAASLVLRFVRSGVRERQQLKIFGLATIATIVLIVSTTVAFPAQMNNGLLGSVIWQTPWLVPPAAAAYAIVRHGLFDIDRVISRTVSYLIVTALLAATFAAFVVVPTVAVGSQTKHAPSWAIAVATLAVAVLFRPVRRRVQNAVDRRFNRARYDAVRTIDSFALRLRDQVDIETLRTELTTAVARTVHPAHVGLWLVDTDAS